jgi:hypothetical protein
MKPSKEAVEAAYFTYISNKGSTWASRDEIDTLISSAYAIDVAPLEQRITELENDRNEWLTQHENLLEIRKQECQMIADRNQKISRLEKENEILILEKLKIVDIIEGCNRCYQKITRLRM